MKLHVFLGILFGLFFIQSANAATWYVNNAASGNQSGTSWKDAFQELQPAIDKASKGDTIWVAKGTYYPTIPADGKSKDDRDKAFVLKNAVYIFGGFKGSESIFSDRDADSTSLHVTNLTTLSGDIGKAKDSSDNVYHVVISSGLSTFTLNGFTIQNGYADGKTPLSVNGRNIYRHYAGGIYNDSTVGTYDHIILQYNMANSFDDEEGGGAGMYNFKGKLSIENATFIYNAAENCNGGAMKNEASSPKISHAYFIINTSNTTDEGGGAINNIEGSNAIFNDILFYKNTTNASGGAIYNDGSSPEFTNVLFSNNSAGNCGGGMDADGGSDVKLNDVTFSNNYAAKDGGGLYSWKSNASVNNVRFYNNQADNNGGGMYCYNTCKPIVTNSIFHKNNAGNDYGGFGLERNSEAVVTNVELSKNIAKNNGGGIGSHDNNGTSATLILTNVTIVNNIAAHGGGGYDHGKTSKFRNTIVIDNYPDDVDVNPNLILNVRRLIGKTNSGPVYIENGSTNPYGTSISGPFFIDTTNNNFRLKSGSGAIDKGDSSFFNTSMSPDLSAIKTDIDGVDRIMGNNIDIGAYERCTNFITPKVVLTFSPDTIKIGTKVTFDLKLSDAGQNPEIKWWKNGKQISSASGSTYSGIAGTDYVLGDTIWATVHSSEICANPDSSVSNKIIAEYCTKNITPIVVLNSSPTTQIFAGTKVIFTLNIMDAGQNPEIKWWKNGKQILGASDTIYSGIADTDFNSGDSIWATVLSKEKCANPESSKSNKIGMDYCSKIISPIVVLKATPDTIKSGTTVKFALTITDAGKNPEIKWWKNGQQILGASDTIYIGIADTDFNNGDTIWASVLSKEKCANTESSKSKKLITDYCSKIITPDIILTSSPDTAIKFGTVVTFKIALTNAGKNPEIKWWKNGKQISGASDTIYTGIADTDFNSGDSIWATVLSNEKCANSESSISNKIGMDYCSKIISPIVVLKATPDTIKSGTTVKFALTITDAGKNPEIKWWKNGQQISGASDTIYTGIADTDFNNGDTIWASVISKEKCANTESSISNKKEIIYISTGNVNSLASTYKLSIFPNPSDGSFSLNGNLENGKQYSLTVVDITGRKIYDEKFDGSITNKLIQLPESVVSGVYFLSIYQPEQGGQTIRFMVK